MAVFMALSELVDYILFQVTGCVKVYDPLLSGKDARASFLITLATKRCVYIDIKLKITTTGSIFNSN